MRQRIPMPAGSRYGALTVLFGQQFPLATSYADRRYLHVITLCDCGQFRTVQSANLRRGNTKSCGCKAHWKRKTA